VACTLGIVLSVLMLCFYKYAHFFTAEVLTLINPGWGPALENSARKLLPALAAPAGNIYLFCAPAGMSFFRLRVRSLTFTRCARAASR